MLLKRDDEIEIEFVRGDEISYTLKYLHKIINFSVQWKLGERNGLKLCSELSQRPPACPA